jgi:light-regulated signal transduction histidine kinase (bacteriophytochrome)
VLSYKNDYSWEHNIVTADGENKKLESVAKLVRNDLGEVVKIIGTTRDITQLRTYEKSLEATVRELNRSNRDLEEFAYVASHDLQEPLRKLSTFSERLVAKAGGQLGDEGVRYTERILAATDNMRILIDNLLEFSRAARPHIPFERVDLNIILKQTISDLEISIEQSEAVVEYQLMPTIDAINSQMQQLFTNLIGNAIKFRKPSRPPRIEIRSEPLSVHQKDDLGLLLDAEYHRIEVRDNGIGFEQEYSQKIFQIFQRLHGKVEYPGSGVGLAICKKIVENHRGIIFAEGHVGEGAVFTIILPEKHV